MMDNSGFRSPGDAAGRSARESTIDQDCFFEGTFRTPGNMRIEGTYQGAVECHGTLLIAETGKVNARVAAGSLIIAGEFAGEAQCESRFELLKTGRASGSVAARSTVVHDGAFFEGDIRMGGETRPVDRPAASGATTAGDDQPRPVVSGAATGSQRRRPSADVPEPEPAPADAEPAPRMNGRAQGAGRDVLPNRTGEEA